MTTKFRWAQVPRATAVAETVQLLLALASFALGWLTLPLFYATLGVEVCWWS